MEISANESDWVIVNFTAIKESIQSVKPQNFFLRKHKTILLNLLALGIGCLGMIVIRSISQIVFLSSVFKNAKPIMISAEWKSLFEALGDFMSIFCWVWMWFMGFLWGAFSVRDWLLNLWPSIEFDFGLPHLNTEKIKRNRFWAVMCLIVFPILACALYDIMKVFHF